MRHETGCVRVETVCSPSSLGQVLSADAFGAFEEAGLEDEEAVRATGRRYRDTVLGLGEWVEARGGQQGVSMAVWVHQQGPPSTSPQALPTDAGQERCGEGGCEVHHCAMCAHPAMRM